MAQQNSNEVPSGWITTTIGEVCDKPVQRKPQDDETFLYVDIASINRSTKKVEKASEILGKDAPSRARKVVDEGDVIVSMTRPNLNAVAKIDEKLSGQIASTGFDVLKPILIEPDWIFSTVKSEKFIQAVSGITQGALYPACKAADIRNFEFSLPPLPEQKRVVNKLDSLLAQVDTIQQRLDSLPAIIKRFRQSVLAATISGGLTGANGETLLLQDISALVTKGASPKWQGIDYVDDENATLFVTSENVGKMELLLDKKKYVQDAFNDKQKRSILQENDVLTNIVGASIGRSVLWDKACKANINQAVCVIRLNMDICVPKFISYFLNSPEGIKQLLKNKVDVARANVSLKNINELKVFLPNKDEQTEIVRLVDQYFALADTLEKHLANAKARVDNLTQSILAKAFRGELVPQDPSDEPAEQLLARIKAARAEAEKLAKAAKASARKAAKSTVKTTAKKTKGSTISSG
ncbi:restriction endonuclease subunit S [Thalassotalea euphylliae]|uniref:Restriction endonuclease subunit S n=1 Tax=Thalassotalea euphylliae TaxID=1655234 RepID=A0A3E0TT80_9GAMM|nr:restriction endonuclease subunit S [Thalassotalea euphylliae]REL27748.1 restriction endonuclease subunit S [Thalassotalea euphylliae]